MAGPRVQARAGGTAAQPRNTDEKSALYHRGRTVALVQLSRPFLVFVYVWLPYMILPTQAALERVPANFIEAAADLGADPRQTFRTVTLPLALPGIVAGSIFTFSLTLGDYIVPQIVGNSRPFIGQAVYTLQGTAGNIPLAAAFTFVPVAIMAAYLWTAKRMGAFDVL